jgi:hypothetical protein
LTCQWLGKQVNPKRKEHEMSTANRPLDTLRLPGGIKATIWKNTTQGGKDFNSVEISRTYKTKDGYRDSHSFSPNELLIVARLADMAYGRIAELNAEQGDREA